MASVETSAVQVISAAFASLFLSLLLWTIYGIIWRLYLSPISRFPGPKLAAVTYWYEFYYDVFPNYGQYTFHTGNLHKKYGPIVRINPYELHISTPQFYETLYSSSKKRDKWYWQTKMLGVNSSAFATVNHVKHRERRSALNPYFSAASARRLQPVVDERVRACVARFRDLKGSGDVARLVVITSAFANDVIMVYSFGRTYNRLERPDFDVAAYEATHNRTMMGNLMRHMIWLMWIIKSLPFFVAKRLFPDVISLREVEAAFQGQVLETMKEQKVRYEDLSHPTLFHELLHSKLPPSEKSVQRLGDEARTIVNAGSETVAWTLTVAVYHLLANPQILRHLKTELAEAILDPEASTSLTALEQLPYLVALVKEALRLSYGVASRLARVPHEPLQFENWVIPAGTPVSMTCPLLHHDESIFPDSKEFKPERWIEDPRLDRYMVSFSRGSRQCVGMHLAYAEIYLWLSGVFRRFGSKEVRFEDDEGVIELVDTVVEDVELAADCFIPVAKKGSKGVRIRVLP